MFLTYRDTIHLRARAHTDISSLSILSYTVCLKGKCTDFPMDELEM
jgi:hypothetical protein